MSASKLPAPETGSSDSGDEEGQSSCDWDWQNCTPLHGPERFVMALQLLGIDLSKAVPNKVRRQAITSLDVKPSMDLIIGYFAKTPTKERLLILSWFKQIPLYLGVGLPWTVAYLAGLPNRFPKPIKLLAN